MIDEDVPCEDVLAQINAAKSALHKAGQVVLATPTAIMAAIGNATKHGFLVREGDALERLAKVSRITFDKTGTLTWGKPEVVAVKSATPAMSDDELYRYAASIESYSEHPLGKAIINCYKKSSSDAISEVKKSDVGIAMGGVGSDIAVDATDIALVNDDIKELPHLMALSKRMMVTIKCNLTFSMALNFLAIILAITGVLDPVVGALVHNCGSVLIIVNSALLLHWKKEQ